jgi:flagellar M-ring protein FliF
MMEPVPPLSLSEVFMRQIGNLINAATILVVASLLIWFGLRPAVTAILARPETETAYEAIASPAIEELGTAAVAASAAAQLDAGATPNLIEDLTDKMNRTPQKKLEQLIEFDEEQAASILKQWLIQEAA